jgi:hypothetical protein
MVVPNHEIDFLKFLHDYSTLQEGHHTRILALQTICSALIEYVVRHSPDDALEEISAICRDIIARSTITTRPGMEAEDMKKKIEIQLLSLLPNRVP